MAALASQFALGILSLPLSTGIPSGLLRTVSIGALGFWMPLLTLSKQAWFICWDIAPIPKAQVIIIQSIGFRKYIHRVTEGKIVDYVQKPLRPILSHLYQSARENSPLAFSHHATSACHRSQTSTSPKRNYFVLFILLKCMPVGFFHMVVYDSLDFCSVLSRQHRNSCTLVIHQLINLHAVCFICYGCCENEHRAL